MNVTGIAWYTPSSFRELKAHPETKIDGSYSAFMRRTEQAIAEFERQGVRAVKVPMDVEDVRIMIAWCRKHGYEPDSRGRSVFGCAWQMARADGRDVMTVPFEDRTRSVQ